MESAQRIHRFKFAAGLRASGGRAFGDATAALVLIFSLVAPTRSAVADRGTSATQQRSAKTRSVRVVPPNRDVTVSWEVLSAAPDVRLRLYRIEHELPPVLLVERSAGPGSNTFLYVDSNRSDQPATYELRCVARQESEITLAAVVCLPGSLEPNPAAPQSTSSDPATMPVTFSLLVPTAVLLPPPSTTSWSGFIGGPEPPVPRRA